ncbi:MAG: signal peptidase II [Lachnospiraceae bacterium]|nr:signal peptidase II [Lachnospiraceae bacterium]
MKKLLYLPFVALLVLLDRFSKIWIENNLKGKENIIILKNIFELEYVENTGAAFSSFAGKQGFLIGLTSVILIVLILLFLRIPDNKRFLGLNLSFAMLISGAVGNMYDRIFKHYVVDFFYFVPINFPRFNVADVLICVSVGLLIVLFMFVYKEEETDFLFHIKKKK